MSSHDLDALAELCGIQPDYEDIWGKHHSVSRKTKLALLKAMGIHVEDAAQCRNALAEHQARPWRRMLPPVKVCRGVDTPQDIPVSVSARDVDKTFQWRLTTKDGAVHQGDTIPVQLPEQERAVIEGEEYVRYRLDLDTQPGWGYHRLELLLGQASQAETSLIMAPDTCYVPPALGADSRVWGPQVQVYGLRSTRNWGIGDFGDLLQLVDCCAELGADVVGLSPLHALFPTNPEHRSPYSPSSRLFWNILLLDITAIPDFNESAEIAQMVRSPEFEQRVANLRNRELVDYQEVAALKLPVLDALYKTFRERHLNAQAPRAQQFRTFQAEGGDALYKQALFEALQEHFRRHDAAVWGWPVWPEAYRHPETEAVGAFAAANHERIEFYQYLQWQAEEQLRHVGQRALDHHLRVGLYQDLAVSIDKAGGEAWANQALYAVDAGIGSPPDDFNLKGQNWGLPPMVPERMIESAYAPFIATLRSNMRYAGALRIDHVMSLLRLFWVPKDHTPDTGAYVHYPLEDLLGILALESQRNRCLIIGEDLGTVPQAIRDALEPMGVLSYRLFYFEKEKDGAFSPPTEFPQQSLVSVSSHDLPTLSGFWEGWDIRLRESLDLFPTPELREQQTEQRSRDRARLLAALGREGLLPEGVSTDPAAMPELTPEVIAAVHVYLARTPCKVLMVQPDDIFGQREQYNLPGTVDQYPNWRRKLGSNLEELCYDPRLKSLAETIAHERPRPLTLTKALAQGGPDTMTLIPRATYRVQFNSEFTFRQAAELIPYLSQLGISHCYASPYLRARQGSPHGYDIIDHNSLNPDVGSAEDFDAYTDSLAAHGMAQILDIVPNHMGIMGSDNPWWLDILENGPASVFAPFFDIDWEPLKDELRGKVLVPVLGDHYGVVLENGELKLAFNPETGSFGVHYYEHLFPIDPREYPTILNHHIERLDIRLGAGDNGFVEFQSLISAFGHLPSRNLTTAAARDERHRDKEIHKRRLAELCQSQPRIGEFVQENVRHFNGNHTAARNALHQLLEAQAYRLAHWRVAGDEINYRRFFDINDLAGLRMEQQEVFDAAHRLIFQLINQGRLHGLRIDHPDGLYHPLQYYRWLHAQAARAAPNATPVYTLTEKILATYEHLPEQWPVQGTTGYDFVNLLNGLYVDHESETLMDRIYSRFLGRTLDFNEVLYDCKKRIMKVSLASELNVLAYRLNRMSEPDPKTRDFTLSGLRSALTEIVACFPVYRTYVDEQGAAPEDRQYIDWAVTQAKKRSTAADTSIFDFVRDVLVLEAGEGKSQTYQNVVLDFAMRFQQYTAPVMAKGLEDTAFYAYNRLTSLNEVGGDPRRYGVSVSAYHRANQERARRWPHAMLGSSTHDSKRSEDVRARINVLSEIPQEWRRHLSRWARTNRTKKQRLEDTWSPSRNDEYLLYQTLLGAWPLEAMDGDALETFRGRIEEYMIKAAREAKIHTSWVNPNEDYETGIRQFIAAVLNVQKKNLFLDDFLPFQQRVARIGLCNSLSQTLLKLTSPGVPDTYQGEELWNFNLVDPDNRRPVDYAHRRNLLAQLQKDAEEDAVGLLTTLMENISDGRIKLYLTWRVLQQRSRYYELFRDGDYLALTTAGRWQDHICAFARRHGGDTILTVAPRLMTPLSGEDGQAPRAEDWDNSVVLLPEGAPQTGYHDAITGRQLEAESYQGSAALYLRDIMRHCPVALLHYGASGT